MFSLHLPFQIKFTTPFVPGMCPLRPLHQNLSDFLGEKDVLYLASLSPIPTPSRRPPWTIVKGGLVAWYGTCIWCKENFAWYNYGLEHTKYIRYTRNTLGTFYVNAGGCGGKFSFPPYRAAIFKPTRKARSFPAFTKPVSATGTKAVPFFWERRMIVKFWFL